MNKKCDSCGGIFKTENKTNTEKFFCNNCKKIIENEKEHDYCNRCLRYGIISKLNKIHKEPLEIKDKLRKDREFPFQLYQFVYVFYNYLECPICHWYKFKQKEV